MTSAQFQVQRDPYLSSNPATIFCEFYIIIVFFFVALLFAIPAVAFGGWRPLCTDKFLIKVLTEDNAFCQVNGKFLF